MELVELVKHMQAHNVVHEKLYELRHEHTRIHFLLDQVNAKIQELVPQVTLLYEPFKDYTVWFRLAKRDGSTDPDYVDACYNLHQILDLCAEQELLPAGLDELLNTGSVNLNKNTSTRYTNDPSRSIWYIILEPHDADDIIPEYGEE